MSTFNTPFGSNLETLSTPKVDEIATQVFDCLKNMKYGSVDFIRDVAKKLISICDVQDARQMEEARRQFIKEKGIRRYTGAGKLIDEDDNVDGVIIDMEEANATSR